MTLKLIKKVLKTKISPWTFI